MTDLPNGWAISKIGEVAEVIRGVTYSKDETLSENDKNSVPLLRATNLQVDAIDFNDMVYVPKKVVKEQQFLRINDIFLAASSGSISVVGKSAQVVKTNGATFGAFCSVIRPKTIHAKFLALWVQSPEIRDHWSATAKGTNINNLKTSDILDTSVPLPPLPEQQKIVEILEDHLSRLDAALADVKHARLKATQFRRSLLQAAFTGNLSGDGTRLITEWKTQSLKDWEMQAQSGFASGVHNADGRGVTHLRPMNISRLGKLDLEIVKSVEDDSTRRIMKGDILFNNTNSVELVGKTTIIEIEGDFAFSNHMTRLRFPVEKVNHKYMSMLLHSFWMSGFFNQICSNHVNQASVAIKRLEQVEVALPPLPEQQKIVEILEDHLSRLDASVAMADAMEKQSVSLRRSLLQAAFTGQLTKEVASV